MKYIEKKKVYKYLERIEKPNIPFPVGYTDTHSAEIHCLRWLRGYYDGKTASTPKEYLEALINKHIDYSSYALEMDNHAIIPKSELDMVKMRLKEISFLYNWVYYKKITGF